MEKQTVVAEALKRARGEIDRVSKLLLKPVPSAVEQCTGHLERAATALALLNQELQASPIAYLWRKEIQDLRAELKRAAALLEGAAAFQLGWARIVATTGGYTRAGTLPELSAKCQLSVEG